MSEILGIRREWLDLERGLIRLPDSKTGAKPIVLSAPARQLLADLVAEGPETGLVFPGQRAARRSVDPKPYAGLKRFWRSVRDAAKLGDCRIHDLRHTHASVGVTGGHSLLLVSRLLGHAQTKTTERYAHLADDPLRQAADAIGSRIAAALSPGAAGAEVVTIPRPAKRARAER